MSEGILCRPRRAHRTPSPESDPNSVPLIHAPGQGNAGSRCPIRPGRRERQLARFPARLPWKSADHRWGTGNPRGFGPRLNFPGYGATKTGGETPASALRDEAGGQCARGESPGGTDDPGNPDRHTNAGMTAHPAPEGNSECTQKHSPPGGERSGLAWGRRSL